MTCPQCNGLGRISLPNPNWTPETPREATATTGPHGRPLRACVACSAMAPTHTETTRRTA